jgi:D-alanyl-D-alanine carboxypeptidase-like protein/LysM domain-containing protein
MRFSINDYSISPKAKGWGSGWPQDRSHDMARVRADRSGTAVNVNKRIARLVDCLCDETERRGYLLVQAQTGGYNNRPISGTHKPSNHSWGLAVDLNWQRNPQNFHGVLHTDFPIWLPKLWGRYGFAWGGNYRGNHKDPMHLEFMGSPEDADDMTSAARRDLTGQAPAPHPVPKSPAQPQKYVVRNGDTLSTIANRLHVAGGWKALYNRNQKTIGPDPDVIRAGQVLLVP